MTRVLAVVVATLALGAVLPGAQAAEEIDYGTFDVRVTDSQGVKIEVTGFGFWTGANVLEALLGDAVVEIPLRKIRVLEVGEYVADKGYHPCTVHALSGKTFAVRVERLDATRWMGGETDIGTYRIRLALIRRLEFLGFSGASGIE